MSKNINPKTEILRRQKISQTIKRKHKEGKWKCWNKGKKCPQLAYWKGKKNPGHSESMKGRIPWNKGLKGYMSGENNGNWKGGISVENRSIYQSIEYRDWRDKIFKRDNYTCQVCYKTNCELNAHHIKIWRKYPELIFDIDNGLTLCVKCHNKKHIRKPR